MKANRYCPRGFPLPGSQPDFPAGDSPVFSRISTTQPLSNILEDSPMCLPSSTSSCNPPETPQEPMEFLSRSWSISALEVAKALNRANTCKRFEENKTSTAEAPPLVSAPFSFASATTAQIVMERILSHPDMSPLASRRNSYSSGPLSFVGSAYSAGSPPMSPHHADDLNAWLLLKQSAHPEIGFMDHSQNSSKHFCRSFSGVRAPLRGVSMKRWIKDMKEKKKENLRIHNAQVHAAISVAGVAAAVAAIAASTASAPSVEGQSKTSMAVASAASLVAAQCMEIAECMGAGREQLAATVRSAVSVRRPGDVMTLTAAAATALRAAATLKSRIFKHYHSHATVIPYERGNSSVMSFNSEFGVEDSESEFGNHDILRRGSEFLKRTSKGDLHWRLVFVYTNKQSQVVVKSQRRCMGITKSKTRFVREILMDIPAWPGRGAVDGQHERRYFGIRTDHGVMELECKNETDYQLWTEGISRLLTLARRQRSL